MVLVWVDAGLAFGLGHVSRGIALAEALAERDLACRFALPSDPTALAWLRMTHAPRPLLLPDRDPALPVVMAAAAEADAVVIDVKHPLTRSEVRALGGEHPVLVVDNAGPGAAEADLILAPFAEARDERWLAGPAHVPLRRAFRLAADLRGPRHGPPVVLVSMGASDPGGLTLPAVEGIGLARRRKGGLVARVLANPVAPVWLRLGPALRRLDFPPPCAVDPSGMVDQLAGADVAVLAMGVTVYEAMACGVPAIVVGRTSGDLAHMRVLEQQGAIVSLGLHWTEERVAAAVEAMLATPGRLAAMGAAGRGLVDGRGAERAAMRLAALVRPRKTVHAGDRVDA